MSNFYQNAGRKFEKRLAKEVGSQVNPGSGNKWYAPSDIPTDSFLIESKLTGQDHYVFELDSWFLLENNAMKIGKLPVFILGFFGGKEYAILHESVWFQVLDNMANYIYVDVPRKGTRCTRIQQNLLQKTIKRVPGSPVVELLRFHLAGEKFVVLPKQTFYLIKDDYNRCQ